MNNKRKVIKRIVTFFCLVLFYCGISTMRNQGTLVEAAGLSTPKLTIVSRTSATVNIKYSKISGVTGYQIYRSSSKTGSYKRVKTTDDLTYTDTETSSSKAYYYKVRAYRKTSNNTIYSSFSSVKVAKAIPAKVTGLTTINQVGQVSLKWNKVSGATQYRIYRATSKSGTYSYLNTANTNRYTNYSAVEGKTYYYRVRVYSLLDGVKYYGSYSSIVSGKAMHATNSQNSNVAGVLKLVNQERKKQGLSELTMTTALNDAAYKRAKETVSKFSHTRPNGSSFSTVLGEYNIRYTTCGENIAYGQTSPEQVMNSWMNSAGHRANILSNKYGKIGIGYYVVNQTPYWVQIFTN